MDYETLVQLDETLETLAGMLTERGPVNRAAQKAMFAKAWSRTEGPGQVTRRARGTKKGAAYYRQFRTKYANKYGLNVGKAYGTLKGDAKELTVPARRVKSKRGANLRQKG